MDEVKLSIRGFEPEKKSGKEKKQSKFTAPDEIVPKTPLRIYDTHHYLFMDYFLLLVLLISSFTAVVFTYEGFGYSWDEAYYYEPSKSAGDWMARMYKGDLLIEPSDINAYWGEIKELPALPKMIIGAGIKVFSSNFDQLTSMRIPIAIVFALTVALLFHIGLVNYGREAGIIAALSYFFMPRIFGEAHIAATETIINFMILLSTYLFCKGIKNLGWSIVFGIIFGLALNTKINTWLIPIVLIFWSQIYFRRDYGNNVFMMMFVAPIVLFFSWPWIWYDGPAKIIEFLSYFVSHHPISVFYFGKAYGWWEQPCPWHYPLFMFLLTVPIPILILTTIGVIRTIFESHTKSTGILFLLMAIFPILISSMPNSPKYDGTRLFSSAFPFVALLAGVGFSGISESLPLWKRIKGNIYIKDVLIILVIFILAFLGYKNLKYYHPRELSYYNQLVGGTEKADSIGMEITYWGEGLNNEVLNYLNDPNNIPLGSKIMPRAFNVSVFEDLKEWGILRQDLIFTQEPPVDFHLLQYRRGFFMTDDQFLVKFWTPIKTFGFKDVPIIMLYKTGANFENKRIKWKKELKEE